MFDTIIYYFWTNLQNLRNEFYENLVYGKYFIVFIRFSDSISVCDEKLSKNDLFKIPTT